MMKRIIVCCVWVLAMSGAMAVEPLVLFDFEGDDNGRFNKGEVSTEQAKTGKASLKWGDQTKTVGLTAEMLPPDWSAYNQLSFWMYSAVANGAEYMLTVDSNDPSTEGGDYYNMKIKLDWTGWKHFELPFWSFGIARKPVGWNQVEKMAFNGKGWGIEPKEDSLVYLDDIRLENVPPHVRNGALEDEDGDGTPDGWVWAPKADGTDTFAEMTEGRSGKGVKLVDKGEKKSVGLSQLVQVDAGKTYKFSVWKKGDPVSIYLVYMKGSERCPEKVLTCVNKDPQQFEEFSVSEPTPEGADRVQAWIYSYSSNMGEMVVDDAHFEEVK